MYIIKHSLMVRHKLKEGKSVLPIQLTFKVRTKLHKTYMVRIVEIKNRKIWLINSSVACYLHVLFKLIKLF